MKANPINTNNQKPIEIPRWVLAIIIAKTIMLSSYFALPVGLGLFTFLFNVAQGKFLEGIIVGIFAACVMVFLMQIATVRNLREESNLNSFLIAEIEISAFSRWLISMTNVKNKK